VDAETVGRPGTPSLLRAINDRTALRLLAERGPLSRTQIGALAGLSKPTASQLMDRLEAAGLVEPVPEPDPEVVQTARTQFHAHGTRSADGTQPPVGSEPEQSGGPSAAAVPGTPGRVARLYRLRGAAAHVAGLDVASSRIEVRICDLTGREVGRTTLPTPGRAAASAIDRVREALTQAADSAGIPLAALHHVVIGIGGALDPTTGRLGFARHLPGWHEPDLLHRLRTELTGPGLPNPRVDVENDVNLAAVAEQAVGVAASGESLPGETPSGETVSGGLAGEDGGLLHDPFGSESGVLQARAAAGKRKRTTVRLAAEVPDATAPNAAHTDLPQSVRDFAVLWIADGIGAAVIIDGKLHRGATGGAGEVGYMPMPGAPLVRTIGRGTTGGFQSLAGAPAVIKLARQHGVPGSEAHTVVARAVRFATEQPGRGESGAARQEGARRMLAELADRLAAGLAPIVAVLDPEMIVLTGAVLRAGGEPLRRRIAEALHGMAIPRPRLVVSAVADNPVLAGAIHAALAATREAVFSGTVPPAV
jgi:predicted NBD/HSP70 family sugar kinase/DNA-binding transcriptional ArsR family regulator